MIYNLYTYLFLSSLSASAAAALLLRTLLNKDRKKIWDINSIPFLVLLIISFIFFITGLIAADIKIISFLTPFVFFSLCWVFSTALFYFIRALYLILVFLLMFGTSFFYYNRLADYKAFRDTNSFAVKTLYSRDDSLSLEIVDFFNDVSFQTFDHSSLYPAFLIVDFPEFIFFLENTSYIKFAGFVSSAEELPEHLETSYMKSSVSGLPFSLIRYYDPRPLGKDLYSIFKLDLGCDGTFAFDIQN